MNQLSNREPPKLPPGWKAQWDEEYQTFFYINERTGETQWELPTEDATGTATHSESKNTVPSRPPVNQGNNDNEQTDRGIGSFVMNQAISSATGSKNHGSGGGGVQSFIMNQVVSSVTGSNKHHNGSGSGSGAAGLVGSLLSGGSSHNNNNNNHQNQNQSSVGSLVGSLLSGGKSHGNGGNGSYNNQGGSYNDRPQQQ